MKRFFIFCLLVLSAQQAMSQELFVRPDGGTWEQCDGTVNVAYVSDIVNRACAVSHIFELLQPESQEVRINGGDIVTILNNEDGSMAEYIMGSHAHYDSGDCSSSWAYGCTSAPIPGGTPENPTIIRGHMEGESCDVKPLLTGINRAKQIFKIDDASNIEISCLTITDKSSCSSAAYYPEEGISCDRSSPYDKPFADTGIYMEDASNIKLTDLDIKGLGTGIKAGRLGDVTLTRVNLHANSSAGWNGDIDYQDEDSINTGTIRFLDSSITFSGCALIYNPGQPDHGTPHACASQNYGGYGDGLGTSQTGGDWVFDNVKVMHNNSDGIDLLYHSLGGKITVTNSRLEGNGGNQIKVSGNSEIVNNLIVANCAWNTRQDASIGEYGEVCRALGTALSFSMTHADTDVTVLNNTIVSEGDCLLGSGNRTDVGIDSQSLTVVNNMFYALNDNHGNMTPEPGDEENSCLYYTEVPFPIQQIHNNVIHKPKGYGAPCDNFQANMPEGANAGECSIASGPYFDNNDRTVNTNPHYPEVKLGVTYSAYDIETLEKESNRLVPDNDQSPLVNAGYEGVVNGVSIPLTDYYGRARNGKTDIGAVEFHSDLAIPLAPVIISVELSQ